MDFERALRREGYRRVAGIDEAGRGALAGPVVAGAVILPPDLSMDGVDDSKKLRPRERNRIFAMLREQAVAIGVGFCSPNQIDALNILQAAMEAMRQAAGELSPEPDFLLVDGDRCFSDPPWPHRTVIQGDARSQSIAAASIVAKVIRDRLMQDLHEEYPAYGWLTNVGYPTKAHYAALAAHGPTPYHRRSFRLVAR